MFHYDQILRTSRSSVRVAIPELGAASSLVGVAIPAGLPASIKALAGYADTGDWGVVFHSNFIEDELSPSVSAPNTGTLVQFGSTNDGDGNSIYYKTANEDGSGATALPPSGRTEAFVATDFTFAPAGIVIYKRPAGPSACRFRFADAPSLPLSLSEASGILEIKPPTGAALSSVGSGSYTILDNLDGTFNLSRATTWDLSGFVANKTLVKLSGFSGVNNGVYGVISANDGANTLVLRSTNVVSETVSDATASTELYLIDDTFTLTALKAALLRYVPDASSPSSRYHAAFVQTAYGDGFIRVNDLGPSIGTGGNQILMNFGYYIFASIINSSGTPMGAGFNFDVFFGGN